MLAIIGGTGIYKIEQLEISDEIKIDTPFGLPSDNISRAKYLDKEILFLPRHGKNHQLLPHEINYRANIYALKQLGARQILGFSAMGSLQKNIHPGEFVIPSQYFDWVKGDRTRSFFGQGIAAHVSTAEPTCQNITSWVSNKATELGIKLHTGKTYACVDGPRLGTKAESNFLRNAGCDVVGMTNVPEAFLAREAQICYATIGIITDYDCWMEDPAHHATVAAIIERYGSSLVQANKLLIKLLETNLPKIDPNYRESLRDSILTPIEAVPDSKRELLEILSA